MPAENWRPSRGTRRRVRARLDPLATGWSPANVETVVAVVEVDRLSAVLARLHREGYGPASRVLDGSRDDIATRLGRLGVDYATVPVLDSPAINFVVIRAAGRMETIRALLTSCGISGAMIYPPIQVPTQPEALVDLDPAGDADLAGHDGA